MKKRTSPTNLEKAIITVPEFENVLHKPDQQVALRNNSPHSFARSQHAQPAKLKIALDSDYQYLKSRSLAGMEVLCPKNRIFAVLLL